MTADSRPLHRFTANPSPRTKGRSPDTDPRSVGRNQPRRHTPSAMLDAQRLPRLWRHRSRRQVPEECTGRTALRTYSGPPGGDLQHGLGRDDSALPWPGRPPRRWWCGIECLSSGLMAPVEHLRSAGDKAAAAPGVQRAVARPPPRQRPRDEALGPRVALGDGPGNSGGRLGPAEAGAERASRT
jgi:hypothetical protein